MPKAQTMLETIIRDKMFPLMISVFLSTTIALSVVLYQLKTEPKDYRLHEMISIVREDIENSLRKQNDTQEKLDIMMERIDKLQVQLDIIRRDNQKTLYEIEADIEGLRKFIMNRDVPK